MTICAWKENGGTDHANSIHCTYNVKLRDFKRNKLSAELHYYVKKDADLPTADNRILDTNYISGNEDFDYNFADGIVVRESCLVSGITPNV